MITGNWAEFGLLVAVLAGAALADWRTGRIPNWVTYPGVLGALVLAVGLGWEHGLWHGVFEGVGWSLLGAAAGLFPMAAVYFLGGLGGGDVKLMAFVGAVATWQRLDFLLAAAVDGFLAGLLLAVSVMIRQRIVLRTLQRIAGAVLGALMRVPAPLPQDSPKIPFALALAIGGIVAGWQYVLR